MTVYFVIIRAHDTEFYARRIAVPRLFTCGTRSVDWRYQDLLIDGTNRVYQPAQGESDRIDFKLQLAGVRNVKAARAVLADHGGDIDALKEAEPWLFADASTPKQRGGTTGLPNAGTSSDEGKTMKRWRKIAGLDDVDNE